MHTLSRYCFVFNLFQNLSLPHLPSAGMPIVVAVANSKFTVLTNFVQHANTVLSLPIHMRSHSSVQRNELSGQVVNGHLLFTAVRRDPHPRARARRR